MNGKAVAMKLTPEQQQRLKEVMAEWRVVNYLDYQQQKFGVSREDALMRIGGPPSVNKALRESMERRP